MLTRGQSAMIKAYISLHQAVIETLAANGYTALQIDEALRSMWERGEMQREESFELLGKKQ